nr:SIGLEC family-like protein 1 isoform X1 [Vicugna pacos]
MALGLHRGSWQCHPVPRHSSIPSHIIPASQSEQAFKMTKETEAPGLLRILSALPSPTASHLLIPSEPYGPGVGASPGKGLGPSLLLRTIAAADGSATAAAGAGQAAPFLLFLEEDTAVQLLLPWDPHALCAVVGGRRSRGCERPGQWPPGDFPRAWPLGQQHRQPHRAARNGHKPSLRGQEPRGNPCLERPADVRKEFSGSPDLHGRADPGRFLRSHCDYTALPLPRPTHDPLP